MLYNLKKYTYKRSNSLSGRTNRVHSFSECLLLNYIFVGKKTLSNRIASEIKVRSWAQWKNRKLKMFSKLVKTGHGGPLSYKHQFQQIKNTCSSGISLGGFLI